MNKIKLQNEPFFSYDTSKDNILDGLESIGEITGDYILSPFEIKQDYPKGDYSLVICMDTQDIFLIEEKQL